MKDCKPESLRDRAGARTAQAGPAAIAKPDREIRLAVIQFAVLAGAFQLGMFTVAFQLDMDAAMGIVEMMEPRQQPIGRERCRQTDLDRS
jgi:hypothetical protein